MLKKIISLSILVLTLNIIFCYANSSADNCLWFEFGNPEENNYGVVTQPIYICYGQFPDRNMENLDELQVFYTFGERNIKKEDIFYSAQIKYIRGSPYIEIESAEKSWCAIFGIGRKIGEPAYIHFAKTSFFIFGKNGKHRISANSPVKQFSEKFDITVYRERLKEFLTYNRLPGFPVRFKIYFDKKPFARQPVSIIEENGHTKYVNTDKGGEFVYIPQDEEIVNEFKRNGFRHFIVYAKKQVKDVVYTATCTTLVRTEYFIRFISFPWGISIFGVSLAIAIIFFVKNITKNFT